MVGLVVKNFLISLVIAFAYAEDDNVGKLVDSLVAQKDNSKSQEEEVEKVFSSIDHNSNVVKASFSAYSDSQYTTICWNEKTTLHLFTNGTSYGYVEYSISLELTNNESISNKNTALTEPYEVNDADNKNLRVLDFITTESNDLETIKENKTITCRSDKAYSKTFIGFPSKKRVEIKLKPLLQEVKTGNSGVTIAASRSLSDDYPEQGQGEEIVQNGIATTSAANAASAVQYSDQNSDAKLSLANSDRALLHEQGESVQYSHQSTLGTEGQDFQQNGLGSGERTTAKFRSLGLESGEGKTGNFEASAEASTASPQLVGSQSGEQEGLESGERITAKFRSFGLESGEGKSRSSEASAEASTTSPQLVGLQSGELNTENLQQPEVQPGNVNIEELNGSTVDQTIATSQKSNINSKFTSGINGLLRLLTPPPNNPSETVEKSSNSLATHMTQGESTNSTSKLNENLVNLDGSGTTRIMSASSDTETPFEEHINTQNNGLKSNILYVQGIHRSSKMPLGAADAMKIEHLQQKNVLGSENIRKVTGISAGTVEALNSKAGGHTLECNGDGKVLVKMKLDVMDGTEEKENVEKYIEIDLNQPQQERPSPGSTDQELSSLIRTYFGDALQKHKKCEAKDSVSQQPAEDAVQRSLQNDFNEVEDSPNYPVNTNHYAIQPSNELGKFYLGEDGRYYIIPRSLSEPENKPTFLESFSERIKRVLQGLGNNK